MQSLALRIDARLRDALAACGGDVVIEVSVRNARHSQGGDALDALELSAEARRPWTVTVPAGHDFQALKRRAQVAALDMAGVANGSKAISRWFAANWHPSLSRIWGPHDHPATVKRWRSESRRERASNPEQVAVTADDGHDEEASSVDAFASIAPGGEARTRPHPSSENPPAFLEPEHLDRDSHLGQR